MGTTTETVVVGLWNQQPTSYRINLYLLSCCCPCVCSHSIRMCVRCVWEVALDGLWVEALVQSLCLCPECPVAFARGEEGEEWVSRVWRVFDDTVGSLLESTGVNVFHGRQCGPNHPLCRSHSPLQLLPVFCCTAAVRWDVLHGEAVEVVQQLLEETNMAWLPGEVKSLLCLSPPGEHCVWNRWGQWRRGLQERKLSSR